MAADEKLVEELARATFERQGHTGWDEAEPSLRAVWLDEARWELAWLDERGRLVPDGWRPDTEYATFWGNTRSAHTGSPQYRREHAERECREDEHVVQRSILAGLWVAVQPEPVQEETK